MAERTCDIEPPQSDKATRHCDTLPLQSDKATGHCDTLLLQSDKATGHCDTLLLQSDKATSHSDKLLSSSPPLTQYPWLSSPSPSPGKGHNLIMLKRLFCPFRRRMVISCFHFIAFFNRPPVSLKGK
ncbi:hypothetical protein PoB_002049100 [Plakobranchus ocellatus]|uniref:Uncharacterized protein n=1 Tax=Plakobranchus ocellatus TaxID=259542 RepID=A0AAV3ZH69_9GAST|nr:hypothetical protein PoB_002049100 [Plakobranchus ocellatus]